MKKLVKRIFLFFVCCIILAHCSPRTVEKTMQILLASADILEDIMEVKEELEGSNYD